MFSHDDVIERTGHRGNLEGPYGPPAGESVDGRFRNITDAQNAVFQVNLHTFERFPNSYDLSNLPPYSFNAQESGARISEVEPSGKVLVMMPQIACSLSHSLRCLINISWHSRGRGDGCTSDPLYGLHRYVRPRNVWLFCRFGQAYVIVDFGHFGLKIAYDFCSLVLNWVCSLEEATFTSLSYKHCL